MKAAVLVLVMVLAPHVGWATDLPTGFLATQSTETAIRRGYHPASGCALNLNTDTYTDCIKTVDLSVKGPTSDRSAFLLGLHVAAWMYLESLAWNAICAGYCPDMGHYSGSKSISSLINDERNLSARYQRVAGVSDMEIARAICGDLTCWTSWGGWRPKSSPSN